MAIYLTVVIIVGIILYPIHLIRYLQDTPFVYTEGFIRSDIAGIFLIPILLIILIIIALRYYYIDLYRIKKGKFQIIEEKLSQKKQEYVSYYRRSEKENALYFPCGRVAVANETYARSQIGDPFYVVTVTPKSRLRLTYPTKHYEIKDI